MTGFTKELRDRRILARCWRVYRQHLGVDRNYCRWSTNHSASMRKVQSRCLWSFKTGANKIHFSLIFSTMRDC
jgi:hypothetical protein